jgi:signal transduction histidine kinase
MTNEIDKNEIRENPFRQAAQKDGLPLIKELRWQRSQSIFIRIFITFFLLSAIPIILYTLFGGVLYVGSIRDFLPPSDAATTEQVLLTQVLLTFLLVVIAVIFAASLTSNSLVRPLRRLVELTRLVGEGKLNYRLKVTTHDEIGELTEAFNDMVGKVREQQSRERLVGQLKSEFISVAAHQLRTPLSAVKWTLKMMIDEDIGPLTPEEKEFLQRGYDTNEHMISLVNDLLDAARIDEGHFGYTFKPFDMVALMQEIVEQSRHQAESRQLSLVLEASKDKIPMVNADRSRMSLVLQNLFDNATKYSKPGGVITARMRLIPDFLEISVSDQGVGIPKSQFNRLFTKFFRADNVVRMETEGSGLGLFIVRNIIKNHGGDIHIASEENKGTTVSFTLPLSRDALPKKEMTFEEFVGSL